MPRGYVELEETLLFLRVIPRNRSFRGLQRPGRRLMAPIPAATFKPVLPSILSGCSDIVRFEPPMSTLAPAPTPTVALAVAPAKSPASAPRVRFVVGANTAHTRTPPCV